jgi:hypothetical protein
MVGEMGYDFKLCLLGMAKFNALRHGGHHTLVSVYITEPQMGRAIGFPAGKDQVSRQKLITHQ